MSRNSVRDFLYTAWNIADRPSSEYWFPGPQPISIERHHFSLLKKSEYLVAEKTDGVRHLFVSFETETREKHVVLVNRAFVVTPVKYTLPKDTVLDGELVTRRDGRQVFLIHDAVMIRGESLLRAPLTQRLDKARTLVRTILTKTPFLTAVKPMVPLQQIGTLEAGPYVTDGLVFTPIHEQIRTGTHETMFKWKPREHITIDFQLENGCDLCIQERGGLVKEAILPDPCPMMNGCIIECSYGDVGWTIVKVRTDKTYPNNRRTFLRTIVNLREDIQKHEFKTLYAP